MSFLQGKSPEDREAFRNLRRVLLGLGEPTEDTSVAPAAVGGADDLNSQQQRAVRLINSDSPLTLVLGPPGTGKTERILERAGPLRSDQRAVQELWNNSLFKRLWNQAPEQVKVLLTTQYRSRSGIREAVSTLFYDGRLTPGRTDDSDKVPFPWSLVWVDTKGRREDHSPVRKSLVNEREVDVILATLDMLAQTLPDPSVASVAVVCFYGEQRARIERVFRESPVVRAFESCEARTVDASQGGQWDVVLLSLTRCGGGSSFVGNANRLNVALSRARELAVVIGSLPYALRDRNPESKLGALANYVQARKGQGVWICAPGPRGGIAPGFGSRSVTGGCHAYRR